MLFVRWVLSTLLLLAVGSLAASNIPSNPSLLMVGNGFLKEHNLEEMVTSLLVDDFVQNLHDIYAIRFEQGSAQFHQYAENEEFHKMVMERPWTWVVAQEQSEIPGMYDRMFDDTFQRSLDAFRKIHGWIQDDGAQTVLLMTWARLEKDFNNPTLYPDFNTMQDRIAEGYYRYREAVADKGSAKIAPAGLAFQAMYQEMVEQFPNMDPSTTKNDFSALYEDPPGLAAVFKGSYPSVAGTYLVACVIYATLTGQDVTRLQWIPPSSGLGVGFARKLRRIAAETVAKFEADGKNDSGSAPATQQEEGQHTPVPYIPQEDRVKSSKSQSNTTRGWGYVAVVVSLVVAVAMFVGRRTRGIPPLSYSSVRMTIQNSQDTTTGRTMNVVSTPNDLELQEVHTTVHQQELL